MIEVSPERFEELVGIALDQLPTEIGRLLDNVVVLVEEGRQRGLLGRYEGIPLTERDAGYELMAMPDRITIFRQPLLAACTSEEQLVGEVVTTVVHEVGHHFGIDDDRLHELGWG